MLSRLIYVHLGSLNSGQANVVHVAKMTNAFADYISSVTLIAFSTNKFNSIKFLNEYGISKKIQFQVLKFEKSLILNLFKLALKSVTATNLCTSGVIYTRSAVIAVALAIIPRPIILELHAPLSAVKPKIRNLLILLLRMGRFRSVVLISDSLKEIIKTELSKYSIDISTTIIVAHDGANKVSMPAKSITNSTEIKIGYAGHLYPGRGIGLIIECAKKCSRYNFLIIGGTDSDLSYWRQLSADISNIKFIGMVKPIDVNQYLMGCDILLAPYEKKVYTEHGSFETSQWMSPLKIFEYMATGKAIICSRLSVIEEVLTNRNDAILCDPSNVDEWIESINELAENPQLRIFLGVNAAKHLEEKYTWNRRAELILTASKLQ